MTIKTLVGILFVSLLLLAGCRSAPTKQDARAAADASGTLTAVDTDQAAQGLAVDPKSVAGRAPTDRVIYFDFNRAEVRPEYLDVVVQHGRFLAQNAEGRVRLEGHTDERGTREYNIALGEGRSKSIARMLQLQGVSSAQIRTVSYGEELPVDEAHNNEAWTKNRRVQIIYEVEIPN